VFYFYTVSSAVMAADRRADDKMQEFIDTSGFFVRHGRHRRAAVLPVAPSPEVDVTAGHVTKDDELQQQLDRQRRDTDDDYNKVHVVLL